MVGVNERTAAANGSTTTPGERRVRDPSVDALA